MPTKFKINLNPCTRRVGFPLVPGQRDRRPCCEGVRGHGDTSQAAVPRRVQPSAAAARPALPPPQLCKAAPAAPRLPARLSCPAQRHVSRPTSLLPTVRKGARHLQSHACERSRRQAEQNRCPVPHAVTQSGEAATRAALSSSALSRALLGHHPGGREPPLWGVTVSGGDSALTAHTACSCPRRETTAHISEWTEWKVRRDARKSPQCTSGTTSPNFSDRPVSSGHRKACKLPRPQRWGCLGAVARAEVTAASRKGLQPAAELSRELKMRGSSGNKRSQRCHTREMG